MNINTNLFTPKPGRKKKSSETPAPNCTVPKSRKLDAKQDFPQLTMPFEGFREPLSQKQLTDLLLFACLGKKYDLQQPEWCHLCHQKKLSGVNVTVLEGFTQLHFYRYYVQFKNLRKRYNIRHSFSPSPGSISSEILKAELASSKSASPLQDENSCVPKKDLECQESDLSAHPIICKYGTKTQGLTSYLLSAEEMARNAYPLKGSPTCQSFLPTQTDEQVADSSPLYGLDCEMCETACGAELTRVSLVDSEGCCVLDELVKPENPILNYVTRFSGITKAMLMPVKTRLKDVQVQVIKALPRDAVLVGHSLENDLHALKLIHPHVIDTSLLYQKECGRKFKLKFLAKAVLNRQIQNGKMNGHNPTEDAVAALELAQYFISKGPKKVAKLDLDGQWMRCQAGKAIAVNGAVNGQHTDYVRFADAMKAAGLSGVHICKAAGNDKDLFTEMWNTIICSSDQEVLSSSQCELPSHFLSIVEFSSLAEHTGTLSDTCLDEHFQKMLVQLRDMCTVYAGPLPKCYREKSVRRLFQHCGPIQHIRILDGMWRAHAEIVFEMLEGAHLAVDTLNGYELDGYPIKVQKPVKESTLDLEVALKKLESDVLNSNVIYIMGIPKTTLCPDFTQFGPAEGVILPKKTSPGKRRKDAFIKYENVESLKAGPNSSVELNGNKLRSCKALTPCHLSSWTSHTKQTSAECASTATSAVRQEQGASGQLPWEAKMKKLVRKLDKKLGKLFQSLPDKTLSVVLLPGQKRAGLDVEGLCLMGIKGDSCE
ncbi:RNA exonuclease 5 isoform X3 [Scleropages formosus]|uniref:RNA exonuclease 5 isoform X3 n=1 Tax=Scleropages formosus TaxID=113540 RepID=UPI0008785775|nr:RNA exonuclease 5 isoform X3 [Scleropages formosus]